MSSNKPVFGYWGIRGLASPIRYLLEYANVDYVDKQYTAGPAPTFDRKQWLDEKFTLGLDFPNLPYYIDGDVKLSQSLVIMRHLARKHNLVGKNEADQLRVELLEAQVRDYHMKMAMCCYNPNFEQMWPEHLKEMPERLAALSAFLGERQFVAGDYVTYADFLLFEYLEFNRECLHKEVDIGKYPNLEAFHKRVRQLPAIDKYFNSERFVKGPFNGPMAKFGGKLSDQVSFQ